MNSKWLCHQCRLPDANKSKGASDFCLFKSHSSSLLCCSIRHLVLWGSFCSLQCLLHGFLSDCSLPCVGDELVWHNVRWCQQWGNRVPGLACSCPPCCHLYHRLNRLLGQRGTCGGRGWGGITLAVGSWDCGP